MNGCNWVAQSEEDDGGGVGAGEKDVVALQLNIFTNSFVFVFFYLMYVSEGGWENGGDDDLWGGYNDRVFFLVEWFGRGGGRLSEV